MHFLAVASSLDLYLIDDDYSGEPHIYESDEAATDSLSRELSPIAHHWMHIGVLLGVEFSWLEQRTSADHHQNLRATLNHWLNSLGDITLQRLVEAVEHRAGGNNPQLAGTLKEKCEG